MSDKIQITPTTKFEGTIDSASIYEVIPDGTKRELICDDFDVNRNPGQDESGHIQTERAYFGLCAKNH